MKTSGVLRKTPDFSGILKLGAMLLLALLFSNAVNFKAEPKDDICSTEVLNLPQYNTRPFYLFSQHLESIVPTLLNKPAKPDYIRERIELNDGDFLDLDWVKGGNKRLIIVSHGMEGDTFGHYVVRSVNYFKERDWDILAWNQLGCSEELNRNMKLTHHGSDEELSQVVNHALSFDYDQIVLVGYSMGGSQTLKFLRREGLDERIKGGVGLSVTFDFGDMMNQIEMTTNRIYKAAFLSKIKKKFELLSAKNDHPIEQSTLDSIHSFPDFHEKFTLELLGVECLEEFYRLASPGHQLDRLSRPMLVVNAINDPLLGPDNYPNADEVKNLFTYYPEKGGHVGFSYPFSSKSFMEDIASSFIDQKLSD